MHEVGVATQILEQAIRAAERELGAGARIESLRVRVGEFSGVDAEALRFALEVLSQGGPAEKCRIDIVPQPLVIACACGRRAGSEALRSACPECGSESWTVIDGRDLAFEGLEAEEPNESGDEPPSS